MIIGGAKWSTLAHVESLKIPSRNWFGVMSSEIVYSSGIVYNNLSNGAINDKLRGLNRGKCPPAKECHTCHPEN